MVRTRGGHRKMLGFGSRSLKVLLVFLSLCHHNPCLLSSPLCHIVLVGVPSYGLLLRAVHLTQLLFSHRIPLLQLLVHLLAKKAQVLSHNLLIRWCYLTGANLQVPPIQSLLLLLRITLGANDLGHRPLNLLSVLILLPVPYLFQLQTQMICLYLLYGAKLVLDMTPHPTPHIRQLWPTVIFCTAAQICHLHLSS